MSDHAQEARPVKPRGLYEELGSPDPSRSASRSGKLGQGSRGAAPVAPSPGLAEIRDRLTAIEARLGQLLGVLTAKYSTGQERQGWPDPQDELDSKNPAKQFVVWHPDQAAVYGPFTDGNEAQKFASARWAEWNVANFRRPEEAP